MTVSAINRDSVLAVVRTNPQARTVQDVAEAFGVLSTSPTLRAVLEELKALRLLVEDETGGLAAHGEQLTIDVPTGRCPACRRKPWDAPDLNPGEFVCTCNDPIDEEI
ncbi:hypothetical protein AB0F72_08610 [Actinoplanes sp. NPDC023936]|uniref:hypothetical protein n=1 Tax=Actinoplanes sp. NPDC023936 TaxID=3154910 RepID=UPI0033FF8015